MNFARSTAEFLFVRAVFEIIRFPLSQQQIMNISHYLRIFQNKDIFSEDIVKCFGSSKGQGHEASTPISTGQEIQELQGVALERVNGLYAVKAKVDYLYHCPRQVKKFKP